MDLGVDGIISDRPTLLASVLGARRGAGADEATRRGGSRLSRGRSSASCRGWPSSSSGACA